jgi:hypothetical protein
VSLSGTLSGPSRSDYTREVRRAGHGPAGVAPARFVACIYGPALWPTLRDRRRFLVAAAAMAAAIELSQLGGSLAEGFTYRVTDVDDAILNAAGALAVFTAWPPIRARAAGRLARPKAVVRSGG